MTFVTIIKSLADAARIAAIVKTAVLGDEIVFRDDAPIV